MRRGHPVILALGVRLQAPHVCNCMSGPSRKKQNCSAISVQIADSQNHELTHRCFRPVGFGVVFTQQRLTDRMGCTTYPIKFPWQKQSRHNRWHLLAHLSLGLGEHRKIPRKSCRAGWGTSYSVTWGKSLSLWKLCLSCI